MPVAQVLVYPITDHHFDTPSYLQYAEAKPLNRDMMMWFFDNYLSSPSDAQNKYLSPMKATRKDLSALPPTTIINAQIDPLRDDGERYADKLRQAGVDVKHKTYDGVTHEFFGMAAVVDEADDAQDLAAKRLKAAFRK
jgi:acetyl esterase/lipase